MPDVIMPPSSNTTARSWPENAVTTPPASLSRRPSRPWPEIVCTSLLRLLLLVLVPLLPGCGRNPAGSAGDAGSVATHAHDPRHGGTLVVLGEEEYHLELVQNRELGLLQVYVFDGHIDNFVRLPDAAFDLVAHPDGREMRLTMQAVRVAPDGKAVTETALFEGRADWLRTATNFAAELPQLTIRGRLFTNVVFAFPAGAAPEAGH